MNTLELKEGQTYICTKSDKRWWTVGKEYKVFLYSDSEPAIKDDHGVDWHSSYLSYLDTSNIQFKLKEEQPKVTLDEPQKIKVPAFVAEWYEEHKHNLSNSLWEFTVELNEKTIAKGSLSEFESWFIEHPRAYEVITSMENGYEVEESKWMVKSNQLYFTGVTQLIAHDPLTYNFVKDQKHAHIFDDKKSAEKEASYFNGTVEKVEE